MELGSEDYNTAVLLSGKPAVMIALTVLPNANVLEVIQQARDLFPEIQSQLPPEMTARLMYDKTAFIQASIDEVRFTLLEALAIVTMVIYLFLGSFRALLIPIVTIPLSLVGAGAIMLLLGYSVNLLSLLALVIAIGLVVDDAIIVAENIHRHVEEGMAVREAAFLGARELATPVIAMTITLVAVYLPIGFMGGLTGSLFSEFAFTLAGAVLISGVIALTLSPMMCSRLFKPHSDDARGLEHLLDVAFDRARRLYQRVLHRTLNFLPAAVVFAVLVLASIWYMFDRSQHELAPIEDEAWCSSCRWHRRTRHRTRSPGMPPASPGHTSSWRKSIACSSSNGGQSSQGGGGGNSAFSGVIFKPREEREHGQLELQAMVQRLVNDVPGFKSAAISRPPMPGSGRGLAIQFVIGSTESQAEVFEVVQEFIGHVRESGLFAYADVDLKFDFATDAHTRGPGQGGGPGHRHAAARQRPGHHAWRQLREPIQLQRPQLQGHSAGRAPVQAEPGQLAQFQVATASGALVPASSVVSFEQVVMPQSLKRFQQMNAATLSAVPLPGISIGEALTYLQGLSAQVLPRGYSIDYAGASRQYVQEGSSLISAFFVAMLIIYLVLAAQFESFRDPLIMLVSVPMSVAGALLFLYFGVATVNIYTQIGLITLIGLISKHGILIVQFANQLQMEKGLDKRAAVEQAAGVRLRPILMTTTAMVLGVVPLLLATGAGSAARFDIGLVIAAGMSIGTLFTLFVVPAMYVLLARDHTVERAEQPMTEVTAEIG